MFTPVFPQPYWTIYCVSVGWHQLTASHYITKSNDCLDKNINYLIILTSEEVKYWELCIQPCKIWCLIFAGHLLYKSRSFVVGFRGLVEQAVNSLSMKESKQRIRIKDGYLRRSSANSLLVQNFKFQPHILDFCGVTVDHWVNHHDTRAKNFFTLKKPASFTQEWALKD
jgi:hypothetical protein